VNILCLCLANGFVVAVPILMSGSILMSKCLRRVAGANEVPAGLANRPLWPGANRPFCANRLLWWG
jgi:hypothetical protein